MTRTTVLSLSLLLFINVNPTNAQIVGRRPRTYGGRIIGAIFAGAVVLLLLVALFGCVRRRRASRVNNMTAGEPGYSNNTGTYGRFGTIPTLGRQNGGGGLFEQNYDNSTLPQYQQPAQGAGAGFSDTAPPPYGKDTVPLGPPPPAHTTGHNEHFVGDFR